MRRVLVMRPRDEFTRILENGCVPVISCPVIRTEPIDDLAGLDLVLDRIADYDAIFLTSAAAAGVLKGYIKRLRDTFRGQLVVLGRSSFDILKDTGLNLEFDERVTNVHALLDRPGVERFRNKQVLFVRGERSLRTIPERLGSMATVDEAIVYRTIEVEIQEELKAEILNGISKGEIAMICFFSPSGIESFDRQMGLNLLTAIDFAAIGETTATCLREYGIEVHMVASLPEVPHFAKEVLSYLGRPSGGIV
jgi:uroporphyrinogen-III synthase